MVANKQRLRELAALRPDGQKVLSLYLNLDPSEFPTPRDRAVELESLLGVVERELREDSLTHAQREALKRDIARVRSFFEREFDASGTRGVAVFSASAIDFFDVHRLARPVRSEVAIDDSPFIEPLIELLGTSGNWMVVLVNRQTGRLLRGDRDHLEELAAVEDDVHGQHSQGGWSQARYQRSVDEDVQDHFRNVAEAVFVHFKRHSFDHLLLGGPTDALTEFEGKLHAYLRERLAGRIEIDVENSSADDVATAAATKIAEFEQAEEREALGRLREGVSKGTRGAAGLDDVLAALNERRVETLLVNQGFQANGCTCPQCGSVYSQDGGTCPADGSELDCRDDVLESAMRLALEQSAKVLVFGYDDDNRGELEDHGDIAAVLRF